MNRFEAHPKLSLALAALVMTVALLALIETGLTLFRNQLGLEEVSGRVTSRYLRIREWAPGEVRKFTPPADRYNDRHGPVEKIYEIRADRHGFIWPSVVHEKPDTEIMFLGGSTTECLYVRPKIRFPHLAAEMLSANTGLKINGLNAGKSGNNTMHSLLAYLGKGVPRQADYVVLMHATNDVALLNDQKTYWNRRKGLELVLDDTQIRSPGPVRKWISGVRDSTIPHTYRVVRNGLRQFRDLITQNLEQPPKQKAGEPRNQPAQANANSGPARDEIERRKLLRSSFEPALRSFVRTVKAWGSKPVLMTQVLLQQGSEVDPANAGAFLSEEALRRGNFDQESFASIHSFANAIVRHVALSEDAILVDLAAARRWSKDDVYDGLHFTETGSRHVAEIIAAQLTPLIRAANKPN